MNNTTFPAFGTWYSRYASIYTDVPAPEPTPADVTPAAQPAAPDRRRLTIPSRRTSASGGDGGRA